MKFDLISYSMDFASFLVQKIKSKDIIKNVILFGSVSRWEATEESDIDIFIDVTKENIKLEKEIGQILNRFLDSVKYKSYWKLLGIKNEIKLTIGKLDKWKELKPSIVSNGITLYGKFKSDIRGKHKTLLVWENIKPNSKRVLLNKQLFGFKQGKRFYSGLLQKNKGDRLGKGCIIVPLENSLAFQKLFKKHKISFKIKKIIEY